MSRMGIKGKKGEEKKDELLDSTGRPVNEYIPKFIAQAPWYVQSENEKKGYLDHQTKRARDETYDKMDSWYERGEFIGKAKKFRKGACTNCGAMTHQAKDCLERPRKKGAWKTGKDIAPDEVLPSQLNLSWDGKRDRWNGFKPEEYKKTLELYDEAEAERRKYKVEKLNEKFMTEPDRNNVRFSNTVINKMKLKPTPLVSEDNIEQKEEAELKEVIGDNNNDNNNNGDENKEIKEKKKKDKDNDDDSDVDSLDGILSDDDKNVEDEDDFGDIIQGDDTAEVFKDFCSENMRQSVRNLRIREDTAAYLKDFKNDTSYYDPKSRSIRSLKDSNKNDKMCPSDFVKSSGDAKKFVETQMFAWEAHASGGNVNMFANPTAVAIMQKQYKENKEKLMKENKEKLIQKYGNQPEISEIPKEIIYGVSETIKKYNANGELVIGNENGVRKSIYDEDVYPGNHKSVWGSYFDTEKMKWGYACCHQIFYNSFCTCIDKDDKKKEDDENE